MTTRRIFVSAGWTSAVRSMPATVPSGGWRGRGGRSRRRWDGGRWSRRRRRRPLPPRDDVEVLGDRLEDRLGDDITSGTREVDPVTLPVLHELAGGVGQVVGVGALGRLEQRVGVDEEDA